MNPQPATFDGQTFVFESDNSRLQKQLTTIKGILFSGQPYTLAQLSEMTGFPEASISARARDLRKEKFGSWIVERKHVKNGLFTYQLKPRPMPSSASLPMD